MKERILNFFGWKHFRAWRHANGDHRLCREIEVRVIDHYETGEEWLVGKDPTTGEETKLDVTAFGGFPVYRTEKRHA